MHSVSTLVLSFFTFVICSGLASGACPPIYTEIAGGCFLVVETPFDFLSARQICQAYNGDLAVVSDCALLSSLSEYLQAAYASSTVWLGASDLASEGQWYWIDGTPVEFGAPYWARSHPEDSSPEPSGGTGENCAMMSVGAGYYFQDRACDQYAGYAPLCEAAPDPTSGSVPVNGFWIGGSDAASEGTWTWLDGSDMDLGATFWGRSGSGVLEPVNYGDVEDCLVLWSRDRFLFNDENCNYEYFPLCQVEPIEEK